MARLIRRHLPLTLESTDAILGGLLALQRPLDVDSDEHHAVTLQMGSLLSLRDSNVLSGHWRSAPTGYVRVAATG